MGLFVSKMTLWNDFKVITETLNSFLDKHPEYYPYFRYSTTGTRGTTFENIDTFNKYINKKEAKARSYVYVLNLDFNFPILLVKISVINLLLVIIIRTSISILFLSLDFVSFLFDFVC